MGEKKCDLYYFLEQFKVIFRKWCLECSDLEKNKNRDSDQEIMRHTMKLDSEITKCLSSLHDFTVIYRKMIKLRNKEPSNDENQNDGMSI